MDDLLFSYKGSNFVNTASDENRKANNILKNVETFKWKSDASIKFEQKINDIIKSTDNLNMKIKNIIYEINKYLKTKNIDGN